jgi:hypothetical protein
MTLLFGKEMNGKLCIFILANDENKEENISTYLQDSSRWKNHGTAFPT